MSDSDPFAHLPAALQTFLTRHPEEQPRFERDLLAGETDRRREAQRLAQRDTRLRQPAVTWSEIARIKRTGTEAEREALRAGDQKWAEATEQAARQHHSDLECMFAEEWLLDARQRIVKRLEYEAATSKGLEENLDGGVQVDSATQVAPAARRTRFDGPSGADKAARAWRIMSELLCEHHQVGDELNPEPISQTKAGEALVRKGLAKYQAEKFFNGWMGTSGKGWSAYSRMCAEPGQTLLEGKLAELADPSRLQLHAAQGILSTPETASVEECENCGGIITAEEAREYGECQKCRSPQVLEPRFGRPK